MRTTVDLPEALLRLARRRAGAARTTLSEIVVEALQAFLASPGAREPEAPYQVLTFGSPGARFPSEAQIQEALEADEAESLRLGRR
jgi:hypothetical protein